MTQNEFSVGIVMLLYNRSDVAVQCIKSLVCAKTSVPWELFLLDNGSKIEESIAVQEVFDTLHSEGLLKGKFVRSSINHGFPGGNNLGLRYFMAKDSISHICLLNSDVIVTDHWLDRLLEKGFDAVGPVTNACGNEQTIPVSRDLSPEDDVFFEVNQWAKERHDMFGSYCKQTSFLGFFCFIARFELFLKVGFLDERFGMGAYEDDDYCLRILAAKYQMFIARDVFIYHWGTASFSKIPTRQLSKMLGVNKLKFEAKHRQPWHDRSLLPVQGVMDDLEFLSTASNVDSGRTVQLFTARCKEYLTQIIQQKCAPQGIKQAVVHFFSGIKSRILQYFESTLLGAFIKFMTAILTANPIIVLSRFYPDEADLKDGYFQRVRLIDETLSDHCRIYLRFEDAEHRTGFIRPSVIQKKPDIYEVIVRRRNLFHLAGAILLGIASRQIYVHSVLRFSDSISRILFVVAQKRIFDVHGVVPEEFGFEGDDLNSMRFGQLEKWAVERATRLVVVTHAMANHLRKKYSLKQEVEYFCLPMLPRLGRWSIDSSVNNARDGIIYCGGLHKWQQIDKMLDYVHRNADLYRFTFLVTNPDAILRIYHERYGAIFPGVVSSAMPEDVASWYQSHAYGLVLREDIVVNRVACPTKLVEYMQSGLVPIVDSLEIGDFSSYGYKFVNYTSSLPDEDTRLSMSRENFNVIKKLYYYFDCDSYRLNQYV